jgi:hypothetical protein
MKATKLLCSALIPLLISMCLWLPACSPQVKLVGSGTIVTKSHAIDGFTKIDTGGSFRLTIVSGAQFKIEVRADDNVMPHIVVEKSGDALEIGFEHGNYSLTNVTLEVDVTMPKLAGIDLSGASSASVAGFQSADPFHAYLSGASSLNGDLKSGPASFELSGASTVTLDGSGEALTINVSGASAASLLGFNATDAKVEASGASTVSINISDTLDAEASGASKVIYAGNPTLRTVDSSGGASIRSQNPATAEKRAP